MRFFLGSVILLDKDDRPKQQHLKKKKRNPWLCTQRKVFPRYQAGDVSFSEAALLVMAVSL